MTEAEWQECADPVKMIEFLRGKGSGRKRRLVAVACCRHLMDLMPEGCRPAVEVAERCAEGAANEVERWQAYVAAGEAHDEADHIQNQWAGYCAYRAAENPSDYDQPTSWDDDAAGWVVQTALQPRAWREGGWDEAALRLERSQIVGLIRDIFGNPFRPVTLNPAVLEWHDATVVRIAQGTYDERLLPSGELDLHRLAVLADALEEAGGPVDLAAHLRSPGPHVRGCFAVDLCLGLS